MKGQLLNDAILLQGGVFKKVLDDILDASQVMLEEEGITQEVVNELRVVSADDLFSNRLSHSTADSRQSLCLLLHLHGLFQSFLS